MIEHSLWSCILLVSCAITAIFLKNRTSKKPFMRLCKLGVLCGLLLGVTNIIAQKYDALCSIYLGLLLFGFTYYDNKRHPVSPWSNAYVSQLSGYVAGIGLILYGILSFYQK